MKKVFGFLKKDVVLVAAWVLAIISVFFVHPDRTYFSYIDWRSLGILWSLMIVMQGLKKNGVFSFIGGKMMLKVHTVRGLTLVLVLLTFFSSMLITNDVALITFVPFAVMVLSAGKKEEKMIQVVILQTLAANLGSMLTPIGNPQNLYLYGLSGMNVLQFMLVILPYAGISLFLLLLCIFVMKDGKSKVDVDEKMLLQEPVEEELIVDEKGEKGFFKKKAKIFIYLLLFLIAIIAVLRFVPFYVLVIASLIFVLIIEPKTIFHVDYALLFTFIGFFIFTGNMGRVEAVSSFLKNVVSGREVLTGVLTSQVISNVPAALLLSGFTENLRGLLIGVNLGGLGTMIASMASLISYKQFVKARGNEKGKYFIMFTVYNVCFLLILYLFSLLKIGRL